MYIEPTFGSIENPRSIIAATKASHRTGLRATDDLESSDEKTSAVEALTLEVSFVSTDWSSLVLCGVIS